MNAKKILSRIDHTCLKATATHDDIDRLCDEALRLGTASVCIPPSFVAYAHKKYGNDLNICTVIGFPLGYHDTEVKLFETAKALEQGASEIDMVINIGDAKAGDFSRITKEISALKELVGKERILKVIIETCYLSEAEKISLCSCVAESGADFIKTSTGFGEKGACLEDIRLFREHLPSSVRIKAAGGIRSLEEIEAFIAAGADWIGSSHAAALFL